MSVRSTSANDKIIGQKIRARRILSQMSQEQLASSIGVSFQQVQKYEKGMNRVSYSRLMQIAETLRESPNFFIVDAENTSKEGRAMQAAMAQPEIQKLALSVAKMKPGVRRALLAFVTTLEAEQ